MNNQTEEIICLSNAARLIPVVVDSKKEESAASISLSAFSIMPAFAHDILSDAVAKNGIQSKIICYPRVSFRKGNEEAKARPV